MLSEEAIEDYRQIYKEEFGKEISFEEANKQGTNLVELYRLILKNSPKRNK
jgi:hypothetical protein